MKPGNNPWVKNTDITIHYSQAEIQGLREAVELPQPFALSATGLSFLEKDAYLFLFFVYFLLLQCSCYFILVAETTTAKHFGWAYSVA